MMIAGLVAVGVTEGLYLIFKQIFLVKGELELLGDSGVLKTIKAGTEDGMNAIAHILPRTVSARTKTDCSIFKLDGDLKNLLQRLPRA